RQYLEEGGWLAFEHGYDQGEAVREIMRGFGYQQVVTEKDYGGNDRVTLGCYQPS
ncbi:protein-(glutamine-N5) methyltransferase, release factor-specific, partial [Vibrio parahaemolyticus]